MSINTPTTTITTSDPVGTRWVVTQQKTGTVRLRYAPIEPHYPAEPTTGDCEWTKRRSDIRKLAKAQEALE